MKWTVTGDELTYGEITAIDELIIVQSLLILLHFSAAMILTRMKI